MRIKMRSLIPIFFLLLLVGISAGSFIWWKSESSAVSRDSSKVDFLVIKGRSASEVAQELYEKGLIKNPLAFKIYVQLLGVANKIQAGRYTLSKDKTLRETLEILVKGPKDIWITLPEGLRREEVVERIIMGLDKKGSEAEEFRKEFLSLTADKEGYLFPDTYLFPRNSTSSMVVSILEDTFNKRVRELGDISGNRLSLPEIVTLASIIERETRTDEERPIVAGILLKRLEIGMMLQADATLQYAVASAKCKMQNEECDWWPVLSREYLQIDSAYNTYKYKGLPPTPISNPGISSLKAVIFPQDSSYLYYLHDREGNVHFAKTLEEHNQNVRRYILR